MLFRVDKKTKMSKLSSKTQYVGFKNFQNKSLSEVSNILKICDCLLVYKRWSLKPTRLSWLLIFAKSELLCFVGFVLAI